MDMSKDVVLTSVFVAFESAFSYSAFLPSLMTIGTFVDSHAKVEMIRRGEVISTALSLGVAATVSLIYKSFLPLLAMGFAAAVMIWVYESGLRHCPYLNQQEATLEAYEDDTMYYNVENLAR